MKDFPLDEIRNVGILGGGRAGKTSLAESLIYFNGGAPSLGTVDQGNTTMDFDPDEIEKKNSHHSSLASLAAAKGKINLVDTPGINNFLGDTKAACRVIDGALLVIGASAGIKFDTETVWKFMTDSDLPAIFVVTEMDKERADFQKILDDSETLLGVKPTPIQLPIGAESSFSGVVDLLSMKAVIFNDEPGGKDKTEEIPAEMAEEVEQARETLVESIAESDDDLLEKYLEGEIPTDDELRAALRRGVVERKLYPLVFAIGPKGWGDRSITDAIFDFLPTPLERPPVAVAGEGDGEKEYLKCDPEGNLAALVFKTIIDPYAGKISLFRVFSGTVQGDQAFNTTRGIKERFGQLATITGKNLKSIPHVFAGDFGAVTKLKETSTGDSIGNEKSPQTLPAIEFPNPVISVAVEPKSKGDEDKLSTVLGKLKDADATLRISRDLQTREMLISTMGQQHIEIVLARLKRLGVEVTLKEPKIPYRETISKTSEASYRHKKQTGGAGQFAEVQLRVEPLPRGTGFEYDWKVFGGAISTSFRPSVEKGIRQVLEKGVIAGCPVCDVKAIVIDGKEHPVDSKDIAFQVAGREVFKTAFKSAGPKLLEPIMSLEIIVPDEYVGDVMGDLNSRRGRVAGVDGGGGRQIVRANVPLAEILRYATDLTSMTGGRGQFTMELDKYEDVPALVAEKIMTAHQEDKEEKKA